MATVFFYMPFILFSLQMAASDSLGIPFRKQVASSRGCREFALTKCIIYGERNDQQSNEAVSTHDEFPIDSVMVFGVLPLLSLAFPVLLDSARTADENTAKTAVQILIAGKRLYIYLLAASIVAAAGIRGANDDPKLGGRISALTADILGLPTDDDSQVKAQLTEELKSLDTLSGESQSVGLPLLVASSLAGSLLLLQLGGGTDHTELGKSGQDVGQIVQSSLPMVSQLTNAAILTLFTRGELERAFSFSGLINPSNNGAFALGSAVILTTAAFLGPAPLVWPVQNIVCMCLAIAVSRAIQLPKLPFVAAALAALCVYDGASVLLLSSHAASSSPAAVSAMNTVALDKMGPLWQPGLLEVRIGGRVSDILGLGDAVFPSIFVTLMRRFDLASKEEKRPYFVTSLVGFGAGCFLCEFAPGIDSTGLPALLFLVPAMFVSVGAVSLFRKEASLLWEFDSSDVE